MDPLILDVNVLMSATGAGDPRYRSDSGALLEFIRSTPDLRIVVDDEERILNNYREKLRGTPRGLKWITTMLSEGKVEFVSRARIAAHVRERLRRAGFSPRDNDYKLYLRTAAAVGGVIVSHDPDFSRRGVGPIVRRELHVTALSAAAVLERLQACYPREQPSAENS